LTVTLIGEIEEMKEVADVIVGTCLVKLVQLGRVTRQQVNGKWYVSFNKSILSGKGFAGGATLDRNNNPVLYLSPDLSVAALVWLITHEAVHLMQLCKGELIPMIGYHIWQGRPYRSLPADHPDYFTAQPWETEAQELQPLLLEHLKSKGLSPGQQAPPTEQLEAPQ
jgi:hypothetical protein